MRFILHEGTDYVKNAKDRLKASPLFNHIPEDKKDTLANDIVEELRNNVSSLKSNRASKYVQGIIRMCIDTNNWDEVRSILAETTFFNMVIPHILKLKSDNKNTSEIKQIDEGIMRSWSFQDFKDWFAPIHRVIKDDDVFTGTNKKSSYTLIPIDSYTHFNTLFGGPMTGDVNIKASSPWCHANSEGVYSSWVKGGARKFFVLAQDNYQNIKPQKTEGNPKDEYGLSLLAILVDVNTGDLLNCTLRWNHIRVKSMADNQFLTFSEISNVVGFDVKKAIHPYIKKEQAEFGIRNKELLASISSKLSQNTVIETDTFTKEEKRLLGKLIIPNNVTRIGAYAFAGCSSITSIEISDSVIEIGENAFSSCNGAITLKISNSIKEINKDVFSHCYALISIEIPNSVQYIGDGAFRFCHSASTLKIGNSVKKIGAYAFAHSSSRTSIELPASLQTIGNGAFVNNPSLKTIYYSGTPEQWDNLKTHFPKNVEVIFTQHKQESMKTSMRFKLLKESVLNEYDAEKIKIANATSRSKGASALTKDGNIRSVVARYVMDNIDKDKSILDFGAGRAAVQTQALRDKGFTNVTAYDFGGNVVKGLHDPNALSKKYDIVFASNVLNVSSDEEMLRETLRDIWKATKEKCIFNYPSTPRKANLTTQEVENIIENELGKKPVLVAGIKSAPVWEVIK